MLQHLFRCCRYVDKVDFIFIFMWLNGQKMTVVHLKVSISGQGFDFAASMETLFSQVFNKDAP